MNIFIDIFIFLCGCVSGIGFLIFFISIGARYLINKNRIFIKGNDGKWYPFTPFRE